MLAANGIIGPLVKASKADFREGNEYLFFMKDDISFKGAFTLIELLVILALMAVLGCLLLPAMARTRIQSSSTGCLANLRQMMAGWAVYKDENNDILLPNAPLGEPSNESWCGGNGEGWSAIFYNTNQAYYQSSLFAPYIGGHIELYRCPGDTVPSANGIRLRSYSMNGCMGQWFLSSEGSTGGLTYGNNLKIYNRGSDLTCPVPANAFIFCDENAESIDDGYLQIGATNSYVYENVPASYHNLSGAFSFADGHAEDHKWTSPVLTRGPANPVRFGLAIQPYSAGGNTADWQWFIQRAACSNP
jgi:prepilin-type processing-associated H-X9-DG protein